MPYLGVSQDVSYPQWYPPQVQLGCLQQYDILVGDFCIKSDADFTLGKYLFNSIHFTPFNFVGFDVALCILSTSPLSLEFIQCNGTPVVG